MRVATGPAWELTQPNGSPLLLIGQHPQIPGNVLVQVVDRGGTGGIRAEILGIDRNVGTGLADIYLGNPSQTRTTLLRSVNDIDAVPGATGGFNIKHAGATGYGFGATAANFGNKVLEMPQGHIVFGQPVGAPLAAGVPSAYMVFPPGVIMSADDGVTGLVQFLRWQPGGATRRAEWGNSSMQQWLHDVSATGSHDFRVATGTAGLYNTVLQVGGTGAVLRGDLNIQTGYVAHPEATGAFLAVGTGGRLAWDRRVRLTSAGSIELQNGRSLHSLNAGGTGTIDIGQVAADNVVYLGDFNAVELDLRSNSNIDLAILSQVNPTYRFSVNELNLINKNLLVPTGVISIGTFPATSGKIRVQNNPGVFIGYRGCTGGNRSLISLTGNGSTFDDLLIGDAAALVGNTTLYLQSSVQQIIRIADVNYYVFDSNRIYCPTGSIAFGITGPAGAGWVRTPNNSDMWHARRADGAADLQMLKADGSDQLIVGEAGVKGEYHQIGPTGTYEFKFGAGAGIAKVNIHPTGADLQGLQVVNSTEFYRTADPTDTRLTVQPQVTVQTTLPNPTGSFHIVQVDLTAGRKYSFTADAWVENSPFDTLLYQRALLVRAHRGATGAVMISAREIDSVASGVGTGFSLSAQPTGNQIVFTLRQGIGTGYPYQLRVGWEDSRKP